jgi:hypothetical protein
MDNRSGFSQNAQGIRYAEVRSRSASVLLLLAAALSLTAAVAMLLATRSWPWGATLIWPALAVLAFAAFGLLMAALACTPAQQLYFDAGQRLLHGRARRWVAGSARIALRFDCLQRPEVQAFARESQGPLHQVRIMLPGQPALLLGGFDEAAEAQAWCDRLAALLSAPPPTPLLKPWTARKRPKMS